MDRAGKKEEDVGREEINDAKDNKSRRETVIRQESIDEFELK